MPHGIPSVLVFTARADLTDLQRHILEYIGRLGDNAIVQLMNEVGARKGSKPTGASIALHRDFQNMRHLGLVRTSTHQKRLRWRLTEFGRQAFCSIYGFEAKEVPRDSPEVQGERRSDDAGSRGAGAGHHA